MEVSGAAELHASADAVWAALTDPGLLTLTVPGLDQIDFAGDGSCRFTLTTAIAAVSGSYAGEARVVARPDAAVRVLRVAAAGAKGKVGADVTIRLTPAASGATEFRYTADAEVDGAIAGIGQRMLASIVRRIATDAIGGLDAALAGPAPAAAASAATQAADKADGAVPEPASGQSAMEHARRGIGLRGAQAPAIGRPAPAVTKGLIAGAAAAVTGILIGVALRKRRGRR
jgi:hypothetical protein